MALWQALPTNHTNVNVLTSLVHRCIYIFNNYSTRARWISNVIIQQIVTMPIYGKEALNICHPT